MKINDDERALLDRAKAIERERVEVTALAIEARIADLLPDPWLELISSDEREPMVEICFPTGLRGGEVDSWTDRECRNFCEWVAHVADSQRAHNAEHHDEDDGA